MLRKLSEFDIKSKHKELQANNLQGDSKDEIEGIRIKLGFLKL